MFRTFSMGSNSRYCVIHSKQPWLVCLVAVYLLPTQFCFTSFYCPINAQPKGAEICLSQQTWDLQSFFGAKKQHKNTLNVGKVVTWFTKSDVMDELQSCVHQWNVKKLLQNKDGGNDPYSQLQTWKDGNAQTLNVFIGNKKICDGVNLWQKWMCWRRDALWLWYVLESTTESTLVIVSEWNISAQDLWH